MRLSPGESLAIIGPAASGKSRILKAIAAREKPAVRVSGEVVLAGREGFSKKSTPQMMLNATTQGKKKGLDTLAVLGLSELKDQPLTELTSGQLAACELAPCLASEQGVVMIDGQLDRLDPWALSGVLAALRRKLATGCALVAVTNRPDLLPQFDKVLVLHQGQAAFSGTTEELLKKGPSSHIEVESREQTGVQALVEKFCVGVTQKSGSTVYHAEESQELAARLLLEGYGDVNLVVAKQPTYEEALMHLTKTPLRKLR